MANLKAYRDCTNSLFNPSPWRIPICIVMGILESMLLQANCNLDSTDTPQSYSSLGKLVECELLCVHDQVDSWADDRA